MPEVAIDKPSKPNTLIMSSIKHKITIFSTVLILSAFSLMMLIPVEYIPVDTQFDKLFHACLFTLITFALFFFLRHCFLKTIMVAVAIAIFSELVQVILPYRSGSIDDLWADLIGIMIASFILFLGTTILSNKTS